MLWAKYNLQSERTFETPCRLKAQNLLKYGIGKRTQLDRDLLILQRALNNKVPDWPEIQKWKLLLIIDQFQNSQLKAMVPKFL